MLLSIASVTEAFSMQNKFIGHRRGRQKFSTCGGVREVVPNQASRKVWSGSLVQASTVFFEEWVIIH